MEKNFYFGGNMLPSGLGPNNRESKNNEYIPKEIEQQINNAKLKEYYKTKQEEKH